MILNAAEKYELQRFLKSAEKIIQLAFTLYSVRYHILTKGILYKIPYPSGIMIARLVLIERTEYQPQ